MKLDDNIELLSEIGSGGMGAVWRAHHAAMKKNVAVKLLHKRLLTPERLLRFRLEAQLASSLRHPNIVQVYSFGKNDDLGPYIVMELIDGESLDDRLSRSVLEPGEFNDIFAQCCRALQYAHEMGIVHRDLKPANIMLVDDKAGGVTVKVGDFGIAKFLDETRNIQHLTQTGEIIGTPYYMSPEACGAEALDARSDIYSLGCVMYHALTGRPPCSGENAVEVMMKHLEGAPDSAPLAKVPAGLRGIVLLSLSRQPEHRQQNMSELEEDIAVGHPSKVGPKAGKKVAISRRKVIVAVGSVALLLFGSYMLLQLRHAQNITKDMQPTVQRNDQYILEKEAPTWESLSPYRRVQNYQEIIVDAKNDLRQQLHEPCAPVRCTRLWSDQDIKNLLRAVEGADRAYKYEALRNRGPWDGLTSILQRLINRDLWKMSERHKISGQELQVIQAFHQKADAIARTLKSAYATKQWKDDEGYRWLTVASNMLAINGQLYERAGNLDAAIKEFETARRLRREALPYARPGEAIPRSDLACSEGEIELRLGNYGRAVALFQDAAGTLPIESSRLNAETQRSLNFSTLAHRIYRGLSDALWLCGDGEKSCTALRTDLCNRGTPTDEDDPNERQKDRTFLVECEAMLGLNSRALQDMGSLARLNAMPVDAKAIGKVGSNILAKQAVALSLCGKYDQSAIAVHELEQRSSTGKTEQTTDTDEAVAMRKLMAFASTRFARALNSLHEQDKTAALASYDASVKAALKAIRAYSDPMAAPTPGDVGAVLSLYVVAQDYAHLLEQTGHSQSAKAIRANVAQACKLMPKADFAAQKLLQERSKNLARI